MNVIVIPVSLDSRRVKRKPLCYVQGEPLVVRTVKQALKCKVPVVVVCDSMTVKEHVEDLCTTICDTTQGIWCGTHRIATVAPQIPLLHDADTIVNWQVDEPFVHPDDVAKLIKLRNEDNARRIGTLVCPCKQKDHDDQHVVKVALSGADCVDRFSREWIPHAWRHLGVYAFRGSDMVDIGMSPQTEESYSTGLEQLAWMQSGWKLFASVVVRPVGVSVNTEDDLRLANAGKG